MAKWINNVLIACFCFLGAIANTVACTDFRITAQDGSTLITRTMEFAVDLQSNIRTATRGLSFQMTTPDGKPAMSWKNKYGYIYLDGMNYDAVIDGMNEHGLSLEALFLPGETTYQTVPAGQESHALPYLALGAWVLGNFQTVNEVKQALPSLVVFEQKVENMIFPLHFSIYDSTGQGLVVEFVKGKMKIYENSLGVMTNSPVYPWHITNLRNYINLTPFTPKPVIDHGLTFAATGQGAGMVGLPGDISPPSRFVKAAILLKVIMPPANAAEALNTAIHVMNNFDIPLGVVREAKTGQATNEYTQWTVYKDLTQKHFHFRTYANLAIKMIDLSKLNFSENAQRLKMPVNSKPAVQDVTAEFLTKTAAN